MNCAEIMCTFAHPFQAHIVLYRSGRLRTTVMPREEALAEAAVLGGRVRAALPYLIGRVVRRSLDMDPVASPVRSDRELGLALVRLHEQFRLAGEGIGPEICKLVAEAARSLLHHASMERR
jgi:hypothetical protein